MPIVTYTPLIRISIFGTFVFPFPLDSHENPIKKGIPFQRTSLVVSTFTTTVRAPVENSYSTKRGTNFSCRKRTEEKFAKGSLQVCVMEYSLNIRKLT